MSGTLGELAHSRADLSVVALPNEELVSAREVAGRIRCQAALIISSGVDQAHAKDLHAIALKHGIHLLGPNCLGYQRPRLKINASVAGSLARQGSLALISQSGALTSSILDWGSKNAVGFSTVVSLGPHTAVDLAQTLDFLATDPATESIASKEILRDFQRSRCVAHLAPTIKCLRYAVTNLAGRGVDKCAWAMRNHRLHRDQT